MSRRQKRNREVDETLPNDTTYEYILLTLPAGRVTPEGYEENSANMELETIGEGDDSQASDDEHVAPIVVSISDQDLFRPAKKNRPNQALTEEEHVESIPDQDLFMIH